MKIFVSWSGPQALQVAEALKTWLPSILMKKVELFVSSQDIAKGERGLSVIADELEGHNYGLVVLSRANLNSPWVNFETGALTKSLGKSFVSPLLLDITDSDVVGPLGQFQATALTDKEDVWKLVKGINKVVNEELPDEDIRVLFDNRWNDFEYVVTGALAGAMPVTTRTEKEMLEEVLDTVRGIARNQSTAVPGISTGSPIWGGVDPRIRHEAPSWPPTPGSPDAPIQIHRIMSAIPGVQSASAGTVTPSGKPIFELTVLEDGSDASEMMRRAEAVAAIENAVLRIRRGDSLYSTEPDLPFPGPFPRSGV